MKKSTSVLVTCLVLVAAGAGINYVWARGRGEVAPSVATLASVPQDQGGLERPAAPGDRGATPIYKSQFYVSYNTETLCPNYVCWSLTPERVRGRVRRSDNFHADPAVAERSRVDTFDYYGSGYDRGHMCPAGDNKNSVEAMDESFCMTNICPQNHALNVGLWNDLEMLCRDWAKNYGEIYICCGPVFDGKTPRTIGRNRNVRIAVPDRFFKVVLMMGRVPKAIGFICPNRPCRDDVREYAVSVDEVERVTGYDFFYQLDDKQERELERVCNPGAWGI